MQLRYASLGSGSSGNAMVIEARDAHHVTRVLLDCGFSVRETEQRLARLQLTGTDIDAVLITHEHDDHIGGAARFARRFGTPLYMSHGTYLSVEQHSSKSCSGLTVHFCADHQTLEIGLLHILPYTVPHDAREPLQFVFRTSMHKLGILTDVGHVSPLLAKVLGGCNALVIEYNYDHSKMAASNKYPPKLKQRITSPLGHLDNRDAHQLLHHLIGEHNPHGQLQWVHAAHLSRETNDAQLVAQLLDELLRPHGVDYAVACQDEGFDWVSV